MFLPKNVRERVLKRLEGLKVVSETQLHDAYAKEMIAELNAAKRAAHGVVNALDKKVKARNAEKGWAMYDKADVEEVTKAVNDWIKEVS